MQPSPNPGGSLSGVAATSPTNAWAVGDYYNGTALQTLIEHWNGKKWTVQPSPNPGGASHNNSLSGVAATSPTNAWAVGDYNDSGRTLIERWNGKKWTVQPSPSPGGSSLNSLSGVAATSATNAWAVGYHNFVQTLIEHWNGKKWTVQPSPNPGLHYNSLFGVAATSPTNAWAVGDYYDRGHSQTLIEHWNGKKWTVQTSSNPPLAPPLPLRRGRHLAHQRLGGGLLRTQGLSTDPDRAQEGVVGATLHWIGSVTVAPAPTSCAAAYLPVATSPPPA